MKTNNWNITIDKYRNFLIHAIHSMLECPVEKSIVDSNENWANLQYLVNETPVTSRPKLDIGSNFVSLRLIFCFLKWQHRPTFLWDNLLWNTFKNEKHVRTVTNTDLQQSPSDCGDWKLYSIVSVKNFDGRTTLRTYVNVLYVIVWLSVLFSYWIWMMYSQIFISKWKWDLVIYLFKKRKNIWVLFF